MLNVNTNSHLYCNFARSELVDVPCHFQSISPSYVKLVTSVTVKISHLWTLYLSNELLNLCVNCVIWNAYSTLHSSSALRQMNLYFLKSHRRDLRLPYLRFNLGPLVILDVWEQQRIVSCDQS